MGGLVFIRFLFDRVGEVFIGDFETKECKIFCCLGFRKSYNIRTIYFSNNGLTYLLGDDWRRLFKYVIVMARKPQFFTDGKK